jgi:hypothetical protein
MHGDARLYVLMGIGTINARFVDEAAIAPTVRPAERSDVVISIT